MEMSGERQIAAPRTSVWAALNDPEVLKACIPGCDEMEKTSDTSFVAKVTQKVGPVKAKFTGEVELSDIVEGESYRISGSGKGGAAGGASGGAMVRLADSEGGTLLTYEAEAKVTGKIAQLGARLINGFAKKMADQFFTRFQEEVEGPKEDEAAENVAADDTIVETTAEHAGRIAAQAAAGVSAAAAGVAATAQDVARNAAEQIPAAAAEAAKDAGAVAERVADAAQDAAKEGKGWLGRLFGKS